MENPPPGRRLSGISYIIIISLFFGLISFISCILAEFKRNKKEDLRWNGKSCFMPTSAAFGFGVAALVSFFFAQMIGNSAFLRNSCSGGKRNVCCKIPVIAKVLLLISWLSWGVAVIMLIAATSMSRRQPYGEGWLNGECYIVRGGTYVGSAILILVAMASCITASLLSTAKTTQADENRKVHAQMG
ncbi:protein MODIFYING WALL LIGNIN-1-like [Prosopis cineraria]|uniref:protein MODIFYING WALL LIGNIN-1-like n=1 Tax=Prosopis cineraria TaxID=364024 RepID=UPI00240FCD96|nr:protein MODIFYING WALL LIGNIN-1-like [Prosopis cineraria]XP_054823343.1 protein MODIFYING WALL LIGNIN-1-like [Prosopis cineraria]